MKLASRWTHSPPGEYLLHERHKENTMIVSWNQQFNAFWTRHGQREEAKYDVHVEYEGPARDFMTDATPIIDSIMELEGKDLSEVAGRSSLESVVLHIKGLITPELQGGDRLRRIYVLENDSFGVELLEEREEKELRMAA
jgi:hypothetical protein